MADDIFSEARAEYRAQRGRAMVRRYGAAVGGVLAIAAIGVSVWQWQAYDHRKAQAAASGRYFEAVHALEVAGPGGDAKGLTAPQKAVEATFADLATHAPRNTRGLAALRLATLRLADHDEAGAISAWDGLIGDPDADPDLRSMARILKLNATMSSAEPAALRKGYETLASSAGPWRALAQEGLVALDLREGATADQQKEARRLLKQLSVSGEAPEGVRQRASILLQTYGGAG